jgi:hypothetical protein
MKDMFRRLAAMSIILCSTSLAAQTVFKCQVSGKVAYQSAPCESAGTALPMKAPTTEQVDEAKTLATEQILRGNAVRGVAGEGRLAPDQGRRDVPDCKSMRDRRALAYKDRDARAARPLPPNPSNPGQPPHWLDVRQRDNEVAYADNTIQAIEAGMRASGCHVSASPK